MKDLFTEGRSTITLVDEGITYSCGPPRQTRCNKKTVQYYKVYKCCMVHNKKKWENDPKHRNKSNSDVIGCEGRIRVTFKGTHIGLQRNTVTRVTGGDTGVLL